MLSWRDFSKNAEQETSVDCRLNGQRRQQITDNRHFLKTIAEVVLLCGRQDLALRGHRQSQTHLNKGNFAALVTLVGNHDSVVQDKLQNGPKNATYTSPEVQNELLHIMGTMVRNIVCSNVKEAGVFSLLADESKDRSKNYSLQLF